MRRYQKHIRLNEAELTDLKKKAAKTCMTESGLIRILLKEYRPKEKPDDRFYEAMRQLSSIANNLNQLAAKAHSLGLLMLRN